MRDIEDALSVVGPDVCGFGEFVDKEKKPICPVAHALEFNGENLKKLFKSYQPMRVRNLSFLLGVLPEALQEFIVAWDYLLEKGTEKKLAFDLALTSAEKIEEMHEEKLKRQKKAWVEYKAAPYVNILTRIKPLRGLDTHRRNIYTQFDGKNTWVEEDVE